MNQKRILHFVIGGHGGQVNVDLWNNPKVINDVVVTCVDWGETSGLMGRICEKVGIHFLPMGDLRNNIGNLLEAKSPNNTFLVELLQREVPNEFLKENFELLLYKIENLLAPNLKEIINISDLHEFLDIYLKELENIPTEDKVRVSNDEEIPMGQKPGNILLEGIYYSLQKQNFECTLKNFREVIKQIGLVPENFNIYFVDKERKILSVLDEDNNPVVEGEDAVDHYSDAIKLKSYVVIDPHTSKIYAGKNEKIIELIENADLVIIPPGSEGNTYPWLTHYTEELKKKKLFRIVNIIKENNSSGVAHEMAYLDSLGLNAYYLFPKDIDFLVSEIGYNRLIAIMGTYLLSENKVPQLFDYDQDRSKFLGLRSLKSLLLEEDVTEQKAEELLKRVLPIMDIMAYDGRNLTEIDYQYNGEQILKRGLRHVPKQIEKIAIHLIDNLDNDTKEVVEKLKAEILF